MNPQDQAAAGLSQLIADHGTTVGADPRRLHALLEDALGSASPSCRDEVKALVAACAAGTPARSLREGATRSAQQDEIGTVSAGGVERELARWAVATWDRVLHGVSGAPTDGRTRGSSVPSAEAPTTRQAARFGSRGGEDDGEVDPGPISSGSKRRQSRNDALVAWLTEQDGSLGEPRVISGTALSSFVAPLVAVATGVGVLAALATGTAVFVPSVVVMVLFAVFSVRRYSIIVSGDHVVVVKLDLLGRPSVVVTQWARGKASATLHRGTLMDRLDLPTSQPRRAYVLRTDRDHLRTIAKQSGTEAVVSTDLLRRAALVALFVVVAGAQFGLGKVVTTDTGSPNEETADDSDTGRPLDPGPAPAVETSTPETLTLRCDHEGLTRTVLERDAQSIVIVERFAGAVQPRQPQPCTLDEVAGQLVASIASIGRSVVVSYYLDTCYSGSFIFECQEEKQDWVPFALADDPDLIVGLGVSTAYIEHVVGHETSETFPVVVMPLTNEP